MSSCEKNNAGNILCMMYVKKPERSKSNPLGLQGENMRIFFMQKLTKKVLEVAVKTNHIIFAP